MALKFSMPSKQVAGLVIRSKDVEVLSMQGKNVLHHARAKIEGGDTTHLAEAIQKALAAAGVTTKQMAVSIPSRDVLFRFFTIPNVPKGEWDSAVQFEARKYIPFKTESLVWDYQTINPGGGANRLEVVFAAIQREAFLDIQQALTAAGVQPTTLEPRSLSLARLVQPAKGAPANEFVCLVDVEPETAHLAIVKNRMPFLTRDINLLSMAAEPQAAEGGALPPPAEFGAPAAPEGPDLSLSGGADPRAERLLSELSVSMDFFMREHPSTSIGKVVLCGDEQVLGPWCSWLSEQLRCPVELGLSLFDQKVQGSVPLAFASAVGLAHSLKDPGSATLNFLKRTATTKGPEADFATLSPADILAILKTPNAMVGMGAAVGVLVMLWLGTNVGLAGERRKLAQAKASRPDVGWGLSQMDPLTLQPLKEKASAQLALLKQTMDQRLSVTEKLDALARALPEGMWLTSLDFEAETDYAGQKRFRMVLDGACFVDGSGQELGAIQKFEEQIKHNQKFFNGFTAAQVSHINAKTTPEQYTYRTFQLNCETKRL